MKEAIYGFPCVEDAHDFSPDEESCTAAEIAFWEEAKNRWNSGEREVRGLRCQTESTENGFIHTTQTSWGIGINMVEIGDEE